MPRWSRIQLLHGLPASLLSQVCSFLSVYQLVSTLRSTCHQLHSSVTAECLLQSHLFISSRTLPALIAAKPSTRAAVSRVSSLTILYRYDELTDGLEVATLPLQDLRSPLDASRFLFSSLSFLQVVLQNLAQNYPPLLMQSWLQSVLQLLAARSESFASLRRLSIDDFGGLLTAEDLDVSFSPLAGLQALTHCRIDLPTSRASTCASLLSALSSLQSLTALDLSGSMEAWPQLLPLLCSDAATPLLLRLRSLTLPLYHRFDDGDDVLYDAFLCRLSSLPAPPVLQRFMAVPHMTYSAAGLRSIFSLPHLTVLNLEGWVRLEGLAAFISAFTSAPAPLVSLLLPSVDGKREGGGREEAAKNEDAAAVCSAARLLLSRLPGLRRLCCEPEMASALAVPDSTPGDGFCGSLYSLTLCADDPRSRFAFTPFTPPPSFSLLTELMNHLPMPNAELELLLSGCPQLLRLHCTTSEGWEAVLVAARCCGGLLDLSVRVEAEQQLQARDAPVAAPQVVASPFLPQIIILSLSDGKPPRRSRCEFSFLRHFTAVSHAQLRHVRLTGSGLTAQHVLSLACLPRLSYLSASSDRDGDIAEVEEARRRTQQLLLSRSVAGGADRDAHRPTVLSRAWEGSEDEAPLGPHQQQEMRRRVLVEAADWPSSDNLLASVEGVDAETARAVFFAELRSVPTAAEES